MGSQLGIIMIALAKKVGQGGARLKNPEKT